MAFARAAFASHVTTPAAVVAPIPDELPFEAAATIPVAFLTAYYALMRCARLKANEWVLVHGGAGGVGLAALQIARWRGARVIATAGSPEKRALVRVLGAEHAFDSRSGAFVEDVRRITGDGVAVVLNSLSGEAMERSISLLRPFGRWSRKRAGGSSPVTSIDISTSARIPNSSRSRARCLFRDADLVEAP